MTVPLFTLTQMLGVAALLPCIFSIFLLLFISRMRQKSVVPVLFFLSLSAGFLMHVLPLWWPDASHVSAGLLWIQSLQPALCFLFIVQVWRNETPPPVYWAVLALPLVGGSSLIYASHMLDEVCVWDGGCLPAGSFGLLYHVIAAGCIFLLLMVHLMRVPIASRQAHRYQSHRYWVMIALVSMQLALLAIDLLAASNKVSMAQHELAIVLLRMSFIYLVMTSLFRLFDSGEQVEVSDPSKPIDPDVIARILHVMQSEQAYRQMGFNREQCAAQIGIAEHVLSRAINQEFKKNFNEFVNGFRVEEAKQRLQTESTSVTAIAFEVGFSSIASFNRVFKALVGQSPSEYRAQRAA